MLAGKKVLITAGPTHEAIDPVRFIGNHSSGKMGYALAELAVKLGAHVELVSGPTSLEVPAGVRINRVVSAKQMLEVTEKLFTTSDIVIFAAAVADYTPKYPSNKKIKKKSDDLVIELVKTADIASTLGKKKQEHQLTVGFALETDNMLEHAKDKLINKNLDFIVLNSLSNEHVPFGADTNKITILEDNNSWQFELKSKEEVAQDILNHLINKIDA